MTESLFKLSEEDTDLYAMTWTVNALGYVVRSLPMVGGVRGKTVLLHRQIMCRVYGDIPCGMVVDHMNGDLLDNRRENLRLVSRTENARNLSGKRKNNTSGHMGVQYEPRYRRKWSAKMQIDGKYVVIGRYETKEEAVAARLAYEKEVWGVQPRRAHLHD